MFSSIGLFKQIDCPEEARCLLPNCIFTHNIRSQKLVAEKSPANPVEADHMPQEDLAIPDEPRKRRRLNNNDGSNLKDGSEPLAGEPKPATATPPRTASRPISPPPSRRSTKCDEHAVPRNDTKVPNSVRSSRISQAAPVTLNPRMLPNPPTSHAVRMQLIKMLYDHMSRLNDEIRHSHDPSKDALRLSTEDLMVVALDEEEAAAKDNPTVYANVIKLRIMRLKKMRAAEWKEERLKQITKRTLLSASIEPKSTPKVVDTRLKPSEEIAFLPNLLAKQNGLAKHGYVTEAPSLEEVAQARQGIEAAQGWEQCDRCKTRFQVFPGRRENDGALASGGQCTYHPAKPRRPIPKNGADKISKEPLYACCNENVGTSSGCTQASSHVFKVSDPKRLALIMPFQQTPQDPLTPGSHTAVCFDCEMGYTTLGLELIRLTATSWPSGDELIDVLVRPLGEILDLNSRFSGVWPKDFANASPYKKDSAMESARRTDDDEVSNALSMVESPAAARALLFSHLTPETPLIGHALDNDLNASRIIHPSIIDTVLLYPHPRGLPIRFGLKALMKKHLDRDIQMAGAAGHDSKEDARAAGDLVRLQVAEKWRRMESDGWTVRKDEFLPP
ncbi:MAG: hypothetical protein Q9217_004032 [Psora testacea]